MRLNPRRAWTVATLVGLASLASGPAPADPPDPLLPLLHRVRSYIDREEVQGITQDPRYPLNPSETTRLTIVSQLLAYNELYAVQPSQSVRENVLARADFLVQRLNEVRSDSPFDGMLAYALLGAYEITGDTRYFAAGQSMVVALIGSHDLILNGGLMAAMGIGKYHQLTGDAAAHARVQAIVSDLTRYQNSDGSFPHWCFRSKDVHYTAWMGMELIHVRRFVPSVKLEGILQRLGAFVERRVLPGGDTQYEGPCETSPGTCRYYSRATGCSIDYDTRAWINELGYTALVLDRRGSGRYADAMALLYDLEQHGAFDDKWAYPPPVYDPIYPWATGHPSVVRTSIVFWSLATLHRERVGPAAAEGQVATSPLVAAGGPQVLSEEDPPVDLGTSAEPRWRGFTWSPVDRLFLEGADPAAAVDGDLIDLGDRFLEPYRSRPAGDADPAAGRTGVSGAWPAALEYTLERPAEVALAIYDLAGRRVRELAQGHLAAGRHAFAWDGMDAGARPCAPGMYFARLRVDGVVRLARPIRWTGR